MKKSLSRCVHSSVTDITTMVSVLIMIHSSQNESSAISPCIAVRVGTYRSHPSTLGSGVQWTANTECHHRHADSRACHSDIVTAFTPTDIRVHIIYCFWSFTPVLGMSDNLVGKNHEVRCRRWFESVPSDGWTWLISEVSHTLTH